MPPLDFAWPRSECLTLPSPPSSPVRPACSFSPTGPFFSEVSLGTPVFGFNPPQCQANTACPYSIVVGIVVISYLTSANPYGTASSPKLCGVDTASLSSNICLLHENQDNHISYKKLLSTNTTMSDATVDTLRVSFVKLGFGEQPMCPSWSLRLARPVEELSSQGTLMLLPSCRFSCLRSMLPRKLSYIVPFQCFKITSHRGHATYALRLNQPFVGFSGAPNDHCTRFSAIL